MCKHYNFYCPPPTHTLPDLPLKDYLYCKLCVVRKYSLHKIFNTFTWGY